MYFHWPAERMMSQTLAAQFHEVARYQTKLSYEFQESILPKSKSGLQHIMDNFFTTVEINTSLGKISVLEILLELYDKPQKKLDIQSSPTSDLYRKVKKLYAQTLFHSRILLYPRHKRIVFLLLPKQLLLR